MKNNKLGMRKEELRTVNDYELDSVVGGAVDAEVTVRVLVGPISVGVGVGIESN